MPNVISHGERQIKPECYVAILTLELKRSTTLNPE
jgi:hypothetical protein